MSESNKTQVAGDHYQSKMQHWDIVAEHQLDYFQGQITKYVMRWKLKNGVQDLEKAQHFLSKYIELVKAGVYKRTPPTTEPVPQRIVKMAEQGQGGPGPTYVAQD